MYHLSTQYNKWLFTVEQLKELRTKTNAEYIQRQVGMRVRMRINEDFFM